MEEEAAAGLLEGPGARGYRLGELLQKRQRLSREQVEEGLREAQRSGRPLGEVLIRQGRISEQELLALLSLQAGLAPVQLREGSPVLGREWIPTAFQSRHPFVCFSLDEEGRTASVALADLSHQKAVERFWALAWPDHHLRLFLCSSSAIRVLLGEGCDRGEAPVTDEVGTLPEEGIALFARLCREARRTPGAGYKLVREGEERALQVQGTGWTLTLRLSVGLKPGDR